MTQPTDRPRVDQLTDDMLDALYTELWHLRLDKEGASLALQAAVRQTEEERRRADKAEAELAALKTIATGYCPHCGRGDCSPTADQWAEQRQRAEKAEAERDTFREVARSNYQHVRAIVPELEEAQAAIARVRAELDRIARLPTVDTTGPADSFSTGVRWVIRQLHENALDGTT